MSALLKLVSIFSIAGAVIPFIITLMVIYVEKYNLSFSVGFKLQMVMLLLWPSSFFMVGTARNEGIDFTILSISIAVNVFLNSIVGVFVWYGINKQRWVIYAVIILIIFCWYKLYNM